MNKRLLVGFVVLLLLGGCAQQPVAEDLSTGDLTDTSATDSSAVDSSAIDASPQDSQVSAGVMNVTVSQESDTSYRFSVTIQSPDEGCDRYANWWEVITEDGELIYRRILAHSHVDEQPFTRSGGPVAKAADQTVIVRSHMHPTGYHTQAMEGSFAEGFNTITLPSDFANELAQMPPLPSGCTF